MCPEGTQRLVRADIGCCFLSPDVLLTGLKRQNKGFTPVAVYRSADYAARHFADQVAPRRHKSEIRTAESQR